LSNGAPAGLGLLLNKYLTHDPRVLFCPGNDQPINAATELAKVGKRQAQSGYFYRHGGNTQLFDTPGVTAEPEHIRLSNLGDNRKGKPIRALSWIPSFSVRPTSASSMSSPAPIIT
jgi:hypothetical protein